MVGIMEQLIFGRSMKEERELPLQISGGEAFLAEGRASAKALKQKACFFFPPGTERKPI